MGKNNVQLLEEKNVTVQRWGLRKLSIGVASVLLGTTAYLGLSNGAVVHADTVTASNNNENMTVSSNGAVSQNLYQSDSIQASKTTVNVNPAEATQTVSRDVTNSNKQIEVPLHQDNDNRNNSWSSTVDYTHDTAAQLTDVQKKINYVVDSSKADQAAYSDSKIKVGFNLQRNQMKVKSAVSHITYQFVDDDNNGANVGEAVTISGNNAAVNLSIPDNYGLVVGQEFPTKVDASVDGKSYVVHLRHLRELGFRRRLVKRVINYVDEQGRSLHPSVTQNAGVVGEYGYRDLVTGNDIWGQQYHPGDNQGDPSFREYSIPQYKGYTSYVNGVKTTVIPEAYVTFDTAGKPVQQDVFVEVEYRLDKNLADSSQPETNLDSSANYVSLYSDSNNDQSSDVITARRVLLIHLPTGEDSNVIQSIDFVKDHDQTTLPAVTNPQITGYQTSSHQVDEVTVDYKTANNLVKTVNVVYHPIPESLNIQFYDVDGGLVQSNEVSGKYGQTVDVHSAIPAGWQLYAGQIVPDAVKLGTYNADLAFILDHKIVEIKPEMNVLTTTVIPGTNHLTYPTETLSSNLNRDLVYMVKVKDPDGKVELKVFKQHVSRSAYLDLVTSKVIGYSKWTNNGQHTFNAFVAQPKDGYAINTLPAVTLDVDHPTKTAEVSYVPKVVTGQVVYKMFDGQTIDTQAFTGTSAVNLTAPAGYRLSTEVTSLNPANENGQAYIVYVVPQATTYTSSSADKPANVGDLFKTVMRTINIKLVNGRTRTIKQLVRFERTARVDANGKVTYSNWQSIGRNKFNAVYVPKRMGYHAVIKQDDKVLPKVNQVVDISADANNSVINIEYVKN